MFEQRNFDYDFEVESVKNIWRLKSQTLAADDTLVSKKNCLKWKAFKAIQASFTIQP